MESNRIMLMLAVVMIVLIGSSSGVSVEMTISEPAGPGDLYHMGNNVTIVCRVRGGHIGMTVYWHKMVIKETGEDIKELVATLDQLAPAYEKHRFQYSMVNTGEAVLFIFNIYGIQRHDSGHYTCSVPTADDAFDSTKMEIYSPPMEVAFEGYSNNDQLVLIEGKPHSITCQVNDVLPMPEITVTLGTQDITEHFLLSSELEIKCTGSASDKDCPLHFTYNYALSSREFLPRFQSDGAQLTCTAALPGSELKPVSTTLLVAVRYAPKIECQTTQEAQLGAEYDITCTVHASPGPILAQWEMTVADTEYTIFPDDTTDGGEFHSFYKEIDSQQSQYTLRIYQVTEAMLTEYHVTVENDMGVTEQTILLQRDMSLPLYSTATSVVSTVLSLLTAVLLSAVL